MADRGINRRPKVTGTFPETQVDSGDGLLDSAVLGRYTLCFSQAIHTYVCGESVGAVGILPIDSAKSLHSSDEQVTLGSIREAIRGRLQKQSPSSNPPRQSLASYTMGFSFTARNSNKNGPHSPEPEGAPNTAALGRTARERLLKSQG